MSRILNIQYTLSILILFAGCTTPHFDQKAIEEKIEEYTHEAKDTEIIQLYLKFRNELVLNERLCYFLTLAHSGLEEYELVQSWAKKTLSFDQSHEKAASFYAYAARRIGNFEESIAYLESVFALNPQWAKAHKEYAILLHDSGETERAYEVAKEGHLLLPEDPNLAGVYFYFALSTKPFDEVMPTIWKWQDLYLSNGFFLEEVGSGLSDSEHYQVALPYLYRALDESGEDDDIINEIYDCYLGLCDYQAAKNFHYRRFDNVNKHPDWWNRLGTVAFAVKDFDDALACVEKALAINPSDESFASNKLVILWETGNAHEVISFGNEWLNKYSNEPDANFLYTMGCAYYKTEGYTDALEYYIKASTKTTIGLGFATDLLACYVQLKRFEDGYRFGISWLNNNRDLVNDNYLEWLEKARLGKLFPASDL